jgi:hypothetical protein
MSRTTAHAASSVPCSPALNWGVLVIVGENFSFCHSLLKNRRNSNDPNQTFVLSCNEMYNPDVTFSIDKYILTSTRNVISRSSHIHMPSSLEIPLGRCFIADGVTIRADLAPVQIQKYTFIGEDSFLQPCHILDDKSKYAPLTIGSHCSIGKRCIVEAAVLGMGCSIGDDCIISKRYWK